MALQISATNPEHPALLLDLPWHLPLEEWPDEYLVPLPRGISRHVVRFARAGDEVVAVKELGEWAARCASTGCCATWTGSAYPPWTRWRWSPAGSTPTASRWSRR